MNIGRRFLITALTCLLAAMTGTAGAHPHEYREPQPDLEPVPGFSWVVAERLAAMARPGRQRSLDEDLAFLQAAGITVLVSLTEEPIAAEEMERHGLTAVHLPVVDFTPPTMAQIEEFLAVVERAAADGGAVGLHCTAGLGRSGTMLAAYLVSQGLPADEAVAKIRRLRPGSVETVEQEERVAEFAESLAEE